MHKGPEGQQPLQEHQELKIRSERPCVERGSALCEGGAARPGGATDRAGGASQVDPGGDAAQ
eukprot:2642118-Alexandrium_andersonii.AAC.1